MENTEKNYRPVFHVTGEQGWINDPNGLIKFKGKYHAFYQSYPPDVQWGPMIWGHSVSEDLVHWTCLSNALYPDRKYDKDGCFSGSAIEHNGSLWLVYTGFSINGGGDKIKQVQCLAKSDDGVAFKKMGVIIDSDGLPEGYVAADFRDPKVWRENGKFYMIVAARRHHGRGRLLVYSSPDLLKWQFEFDVFGKDSGGIMLECPDYNPRLGLLIFSEQFAPIENNKHLNIHTTRYMVGKLDYKNKCFTGTADDICDYGFDYYAPQSFTGENIYMAWMNMWDRNNPTAKYGFAGMVTVPRRAGIVGGRLYQTPVIDGKKVIERRVEGEFVDSVLTGIVKIRAKSLTSLSIKMRCGGDMHTDLDLLNGEWVFNRSCSGMEIRGHEKDPDSMRGIRRMPFSGKEEVELTIVFDKFSVEIFEDGRVLTSTIYPPAEATGLTLSAEAEECIYTRLSVE